MQLYVYKDNPLENIKNNVYEEFGYDIEQIVDGIYSKIKVFVKSDNLLKENGEQVSEDYVQSEERNIKSAIRGELTSRETIVVWNNEKLEVTYGIDNITSEYNLKVKNGDLAGLDEFNGVTLNY